MNEQQSFFKIEMKRWKLALAVYIHREVSA